jgi:putative hydrolase of the HAD superfamily
MYHTLFFDLDNTLYPRESGLWEIIGGRINSYLEEFIGMEKDKITDFRIYCRDTYGTTLRGMKEFYEVDTDHYMQYVHDIDLSQILQKSEELIDMLASLSQRKFIFTNSNVTHASNVLEYLEIDQFFDEIVDVYKTFPYIKPQKEAFDKALELVGIESPQGCVFIDDMMINVLGAKDAGFFSILVAEETEDDYPFWIDDIIHLPDILDNHQE